MSDARGILPPEGDWNEQGVLKSILAQYLAELAQVVPRKGYPKWINDNINLAWRNRDRARGIIHRNYSVPCPTVVVNHTSQAVVWPLFNFLHRHPAKFLSLFSYSTAL